MFYEGFALNTRQGSLLVADPPPALLHHWYWYTPLKGWFTWSQCRLLAHILTLENTKPHLNTLKPPPVTRFGSFVYPKNKRKIQRKFPDNPKKDAWQSPKRCLTIKKRCLTILQLIVSQVSWDLRNDPRKHAWQLSGIFFGIVRHLFWDRQASFLGLSGNFYGISRLSSGVSNPHHEDFFFESKTNCVILFCASQYSL